MSEATRLFFEDSSLRRYGRLKTGDDTVHRGNWICAEWNADRMTIVRMERFEVTGSLRLGQRSEGEGLTGDREIRLHAIHELDKHSRVRPAFMELSC